MLSWSLFEAALEAALTFDCQVLPAVPFRFAPVPAHQRKCFVMRIYVGNLNFQSTESEIQELFAQYGQVDDVALITDRMTGRAKGFGFVEMPNGDEAQAAIAGLNGKNFGGRDLTVNEARPREPRRDRSPW